MVRVTVDPLTRIGGPVRVETEVNEEGIITRSQVSNMVFRGFERIFQNQDPRDSALLSQRICGACPIAHSIASSCALDDLFGVAGSVPKNTLVIRNILQGMDTIANHAIHTYIMWSPDLVNPAYRQILTNSGEPGNAIWKELLGRFAPINYKINGESVPTGSSYLNVIQENKRLHEACAIIAGKMPHQVMIYPAGVTNRPTTSDIEKMSSSILDVIDFFNRHMTGITFGEWIENTYKATSPKKAVEFFLDRLAKLAESSGRTNDFSYNCGWGDIEFYSAVGSELIGEKILGLPFSFKLDKMGSYDDISKIGFISYGAFYNVDHEGYDPINPEDRFQKSGVVTGSFEYHKFDPDKVTESVTHALYEDDADYRHPFEGTTEPYKDPDLIVYNDFSDEKYSFSKAPRYDGVPCETGPLPRLIVMKEPLIMGLIKTFQDNGYSPINPFTRMLARMQEMFIITNELKKWVTVDLEPDARYNIDIEMSMAKDSRGVGLWEAPRGSLGDWIVTGNDSKVVNYQIIVPTNWNLSPRDSAGIPGPLEQALVGSKISAVENSFGIDFSNPTGIMHIGRSYDPCISCAVQTIDITGKNSPGVIRLV